MRTLFPILKSARSVCPVIIKACLCSALLLQACSRKETIEIPEKPEVPLIGNRIVISSIKGVPEGTEIAYVKANITGLNWKNIGAVEAEFVGERAVIILPDEIPVEQLSKVGRDDYTDVMGYWPAQEISDRDAKVASVGDFVLYNAEDKRVGRIFLSDWDRTGSPTDKYFIYYQYADRPFTLGGYNLKSPVGSVSFIYSASFSSGWNVYSQNGAKEDQLSLITTVIAEGAQLFWRFESGIG